MSDEHKDPDLQTWIDPELEARVVAWVVGEASDFEAAELDRIVAEKPELGVFKRRIEAVHGLVAAANRTETDLMRLDGERRRKLIEKLGGKEAGAPPAVVAIPQGQVESRRRISWKMVVGIAACLMIAALLASIGLPAFSSVQMKSVATKKLMEEKQAAFAEAEQEAAGTAQPTSEPIVATAAPAQVERLAALDSLKAWGSRSVNQEAEVERTVAPPRNTEANIKLAVAMDQPSGAIKPETDFAKSAVRRAEPMGDAYNGPGTPTTLNGANSYAGATTVSGGSLARNTDQSGLGGGAGGMAMGGASRAVSAYGSAGAMAGRGYAMDSAQVSQLPQSAAKETADEEMVAAAAAPRAAESTPVAQFGMKHEVSTDGTVLEKDSKLADASAFSANIPANRLAFGGGQVLTAQAGLDAHALAFNGAVPELRSRLKARDLSAPAEVEVSATDQPYSTFSLHVSDVSFLLAKAALARGEMPDRDSIRPEEFYNAFDYGDPAPATGEKIACRIEQAAHPMLQQRNLVRIAMKVAATGRGAGQPLRLTVLLDTSGSMEREDRAASLRRAMQVLTSLLGPNDAVTLIGFARQPRLLAEEVPGDQAGKLVGIVAHTPAEGGTNMEEAIKLGSELALRHLEPGGQNRVVMLTDGAANLGDADPAQLSKLVGQLRQKGVSFDACGVGADGLNDDILEALTRKGGGRYYFLNKPEDADEGFARQLAGAFRPAAENVKMQVRFNPSRVGKYRLIGFEKHRLNQEDFRNDKVTAAQLAAEEAAVALYQVQVLPEGEGELGEVFVRFRDPADGRMVEQSWTIPYDAQAPALDKAAPTMQLAATASLLAEKLRGGGGAADAVDLNVLAPVVARVRGQYAQQPRAQELVTMYEQARRMMGGK